MTDEEAMTLCNIAHSRLALSRCVYKLLAVASYPASRLRAHPIGSDTHIARSRPRRISRSCLLFLGPFTSLLVLSVHVQPTV